MRFDQAQLSVEIFGPRFRVVRMAGVLDGVTVARLACVVEAQLARPGCAGHIVIDLGDVRFFATDDFDALVRARDTAQEVGVRVHLAGLSAREALLPIRITGALAQFSTFATVEQAQAELVGRPTVPAIAGGPRSRFGLPCPPSPESSSLGA
ncbi:STAS domain-containing protein [Pseudonocardia nigra]|uniref:STAS domain-containing protein n=1 Tax=Pseudonocardia nigra TaxID=1921578 RepID=UPI001C5E4167|nr:STAS domain-containing protein [Pseudonocardia nigra]